MKKKILLFAFILFVFNCIAQNGKYIPFPSEMIVYTYADRGSSDAGWWSASRMEIYGDTTLNGKKYSKCFVAESNRWGTNNSFPTTNLKGLNKLMGGIRDEITTKKVYFYSFSTNQEELLYDFDLHLGDTLFKDDGYRFYRSLLSQESLPKIDTVWVSRVDSVLMPHDGKYHKRFNFKTKFYYTSNFPVLINSDSVYKDVSEHFEIKINPLIEGVGIDFNPITAFNEFEYAYKAHLYCRTIDKKTAYFMDTTSILPFVSKVNCKSIITDVEEEKTTPVFSIYPNPSTGKFNLVAFDANENSYEIVNVLGVKIREGKIEKDETEIDLNGTSLGIYFIRVYNRKGQFATSKVIIH